MGDTNMCSNNPILLRNTLNLPTILCVQRKADKLVPTEEDIVQANKLAFNDDIGTITNYVTSMFDVQAGFEKGSPEHKVLAYRIMCGELLQQNTIDRAKGIISKPMPSYWYTYRDCMPRDGDDASTIEKKEFNRRIVASNKPYFMTYVYPQLRSKYNTYVKSGDNKAVRLFSDYGIRSVEDLRRYEPKTKRMTEFLDYYERNMPTGNNPCTVNRICWLAEKEIGTASKKALIGSGFDYSILKCGVPYSRELYNKVANLYQDYRVMMSRAQNKAREEKASKYIDVDEHRIFVELFRKECAEVCTNEEELCDIVIDMCYETEGMKAFAWDVAGDVIVRNLLKRNNGVVRFPMRTDDACAEFTFAGNGFTMQAIEVEYEPDNFE